MAEEHRPHMENSQNSSPGKSLPEGVFRAVKKNGEPYFRASLTYRRRHISLGSFPTAEGAHLAYLEGLRLLRETALSLHNYEETSPLAFEKWVSLLNFRDFGLYFGKPIYLGQRLFYYYLSPSHVLKFDMEDLFFYSSHKIMCRGNHYFVADYGMQINIASRYGIKNYGVPGVDYLFLNDDPTDFRRENISILNTYHGVRAEKKKGQYVYTARIHIHGNYVIGRYSTAVEAAIAYNKAIDLLKKRGVKKNFTPNYVEEVSPRQYAELYSALQISSKITDYGIQ